MPNLTNTTFAADDDYKRRCESESYKVPITFENSLTGQKTGELNYA